jgi:hypothetical protein
MRASRFNEEQIIAILREQRPVGRRRMFVVSRGQQRHLLQVEVASALCPTYVLPRPPEPPSLIGSLANRFFIADGRRGLGRIIFTFHGSDVIRASA